MKTDIYCLINFSKYHMSPIQTCKVRNVYKHISKKGKRKIQGVPQSQAAAHPRHQKKEEIDKTKQAQLEQTFEKHLD